MLQNMVMWSTAHSSWSRLSRQQQIAVGVVATVVVLAGIFWVVSRRNASQLALTALQELDEATTYHVKAELIASLPVRSAQRARPFTRFTARVEGDARENEAGTPEITGTLFGELSGSGARFFTDGDIRMGDKVTAFFLQDLPVFFDPSRQLIKKWTHVDGQILATHNGSAIREELYKVVQTAKFIGREEIDGVGTTRLRLTMSPDQEQALALALQHTASGNHGWNIVARLLQNFDVRFFDMWIEPDTKELRRVAAVFGSNNRQGKFVRRVVIDLRFSDYGKDVTFEIPEKQLTVQPSVFRRLFNTGEITPQ